MLRRVSVAEIGNLKRFSIAVEPVIPVNSYVFRWTGSNKKTILGYNRSNKRI